MHAKRVGLIGLTSKMARPSLITPRCAATGMAMADAPSPDWVGVGMATAAAGCADVGIVMAGTVGVSVGMEPRMPSELIPDRPPPPIMSSAASPWAVLSAVTKNRIDAARNGGGARELDVR